MKWIDHGQGAQPGRRLHQGATWPRGHVARALFTWDEPITSRDANDGRHDQSGDQAHDLEKAGWNGMKHRTIIVRAEWDDEAKVWVATSDDIGIATEADTLELLTPKVVAMVAELLELEDENFSDLPEIPIQIMAQQLARIPNPKFN
jgi:hypothetical protein